MSILPTQTQDSSSSSSLQSPPNPLPSHGESSLSPLSRQIQRLQVSDHTTGSMESVPEDTGGSSEKVMELGILNTKRVLPHQDTDTLSRRHSDGRGFRSADSKGKALGSIASPQGPQNSGSAHYAGRRAHMINGNHLLNFHYNPIVRSPPRLPPPRRSQKIKPYNRDLFLQANYKFVVLDTGEYTYDSMDPDKMLRWEDIICVRYSTPFPVQCPICLEYPLCPQITSCGHIFCFPCILRYLLMGEENDKGECFKRCPLCFVMVSPKDLYTIYIEKVEQFGVGDTIEFLLLTRQKDSFSLSQKSNQENVIMPGGNGDIYDPFSKFIFASDVDLSVRQAISDLHSWLVRADAGLVDDLEKLPYVCAAMEQLEQRKKYWNEHQASDQSKSCLFTDCMTGSHGHPSNADASRSEVLGRGIINPEGGEKNNLSESSDVGDLVEGQDIRLSSSYDESRNLRMHSNESRDLTDKESYNFYQAVDGQHFILHPLNLKCLLHHYGSYDMLPHRISGKILELETMTQSEAMRRRYRYLSHFSLTTSFQLCEIDLSETLPPDALLPFIDEIKKREKQRKQLAKKEWKEKIQAEASTVLPVPITSGFGQSSYEASPTFSIEDFEALGSSSVISSSPPITRERKLLFSNVTRLGFAATHDSPALKIEESSSLHDSGATNDSSVTGSRNPGTPSFANIISRAKTVENLDAPKKMNETGKKGKKPSRVLLSTVGARRY
ncbi:zf-C3HC4 domain-containing protein [Cephalotus follicularis]|uniref:Zf-C3HC4 domain-containing protein n=1 Tax=Cephalotus follicularis TaxID=3775 RepID=A0A1Q3AV99_CEPFO|nr:zf-C3HC4 domain-containing protein [Cephalotus follicularis]